MLRKQQEITVITPNQIKIKIDKNSDPRNVQLFSKIKLDEYEKKEEEEKKNV